MEDEQNPFALKMLVISLGVLLIGAAVMFATMVIGGKEEKSTASCNENIVKLTGYSDIHAIYSDAKRLRLMALAPDNTYEVLTLDACSGKIIGRITLQTHKQ